MTIHGPLYWKQKAEELKEKNKELRDTLSLIRNDRTRLERKLYDLEKVKWRIDDELSNMRTIGWRIKAIHQCLSGLEYMYAVDVLKEVQERLERDRDKSHVKCE